nr:MAG TPA: hypothetical protein [Caudoviricetes sp.]
MNFLSDTILARLKKMNALEIIFSALAVILLITN